MNQTLHRLVPGCLIGVLLFAVAPAQAVTKNLSRSAALLDAPNGKPVGRLNSGAAVELIRMEGAAANIIVEAWVHPSAFKKVPSLLARVKTLAVVKDGVELKSAAGGRIIGTVTKEAKLEMRDMKDKSVKVSLNAWVPAGSLAAGPRVRISTNLGDIVLELDPDRAPKTVANFLSYTEKGFFAGTIFHRVIKNFMIQGGGFDTTYVQKPTDPVIPIESSNGLKNTRGTVAMARTNDPNSATSQFFINVVDNAFLNYVSDAQPGYAVFGLVVEGMEVVDQIRNVPTGPGGPLPSDVPQTMVVINQVTKVE